MTCRWMVLGLIAVLLTAGCGRDPQSDALRELTSLGYALSLEDYFRAATEGNVEALDAFLRAGTAVDVRGPTGETSLLESVRHGRDAAVEFLLSKGASTGLKATHGSDLVQLAVRSGSARTLNLLLEAGANWPEDPRLLADAAGTGKAEVLEELLPRCREQVDEALLSASVGHSVAVVDLLLQAGASPFARDGETGDTALMRAAAAGQLEVLELLLRSGANRWAVNDGGRCAADLATSAGHSEIAARLWQPPTPEEMEAGVIHSSHFLKNPSGTEADPVLREVPQAIAVRSGTAAASAIVAQPARRMLRLHGAIVGHRASTAHRSAEPGEQLTVRQTREEQLPILLESADEKQAVVRMIAGAEPRWVRLQPGGVIDALGLRLRALRPPLAGGAAIVGEWSAVLESVDGKSWIWMLPSLPVRRGSLCAVIEVNGTDEVYEAFQGDHFRLAGFEEIEWIVRAVKPNAVTLDRTNGQRGAQVVLPAGSRQR